VTATVRQILVDIGSSIDNISLECLKTLWYTESDLEDFKTPVVVFKGQATNPIGTKRLPVQVGNKNS